MFDCLLTVSMMNQAREYEYFIASEEADEVKFLLAEPRREQLSVDDILCSRDDRPEQRIDIKDDTCKGWPAEEVKDISKLNVIDAMQLQVEDPDLFPTTCEDYLLECVTTIEYNPVSREKQNFVTSGSEDLIMDIICNDGLHIDNAVSEINGNLGQKCDAETSAEAIWFSYENGTNSYTDMIETKSNRNSNSSAIPKGPRRKRLRKSTWRSVEESADTILRPCRKRPNHHDNHVGIIQEPFSPHEQRELRKKPVSAAMRSNDDELSSPDKSEEECARRVENCGGRRKHRMVWSDSEVNNLIDGISQHGVGKWAIIKKFIFSSSSHRTPVDLKDKWRSLVKASRAEFKAKKKNQSVRLLPESILHRVSELARNPHPKVSCSDLSQPFATSVRSGI